MFWDRFYSLCIATNTRPKPLTEKLGIAHGITTNWKRGVIPTGETLIKLADHFDVSIDYLLGRTDNMKL